MANPMELLEEAQGHLDTKSVAAAIEVLNRIGEGSERVSMWVLILINGHPPL